MRLYQFIISNFHKLFFVFLVLLLFGFLVFAQTLPDDTTKENLEDICQLDNIEQKCQNISPTECRKLLERCEQYYQEESDRIATDINKTEKEKKTLQNKIYTLNQKIKNLSYQIAQSNLIIKDLKIQMGDTENSIEKTSVEIEDLREKLINILRTIHEEDQKPLIEILFSENKLSDFFDNLVALEILDSKNKEFLQNIKILKLNLEEQKNSLEEEKDSLEKMVKIQTLQKEENSQVKSEQEYHLQLTEKEYQKQLKEKEETVKKAAKIRARIFELIGVAKAPTFGEALEVAKYVEKITGVRPAFLLAILQQESALGKNVGQCYLVNSTIGAGVRFNTNQAVSRLMNPTRDVPPFLKITQELGRDPYKTLVSCPMSFGWGGAMGPAQFIPSTWMQYRDKLYNIIGKPADPWNVQDAFLASGLYLSNCGANTKKRDDEWKAAMIYFSGSASNSTFSWYANNVLKIADDFEKDIEIIEKNNS